MFVSVIIPNYNHAPFLRRRIETVLNQTHPDFEVIILDDCSSDNSRDIINSYRWHPKIRAVVYNESNSGSTFRQWKKGLEFCQGEIIWIAESDDYSDYEFINRNVVIHQKYPSVGIVYCDSYTINEHDDIIYPNEKEHTKLNKFGEFFKGIEYCREHLILANDISNASAVTFKAAYLKLVDFISITQKLSGDWKVYIEVLSRSDFYFLPDRLNYYRTHSNNVRSKTNLSKGIFETTIVLRFCQKTGIATPTLVKKRAYIIFLESWSNIKYFITNKGGSNKVLSIKYIIKTYLMLFRIFFWSYFSFNYD